ncbi:MAG: type II/IV secretion system protein, partial [Bdellovibrionales bacterium]|nr:type II/IV secretion system protein [Bdellovibrionales bacterium]
LAGKYRLNLDFVFAAIKRDLGYSHISVREKVSQLDYDDILPIIQKLGFERCRDSLLLPLPSEKNRVVLAMANPFDIEVQQEIRFALGGSCSVVLSYEEEIRSCLSFLSPDLFDLDHLRVEENDNSIETLRYSESGLHELDSDEGPEISLVIKLTNRLLTEALEQRASDIHIEPTENALAVRLRIDGVMRELRSIPKYARNRVIARFKLLAGMDIAERRQPQDGRIGIRYKGRAVDVRVSSVPTSHGETLVMRLLSLRWDELSIHKLGIPADIQRSLEHSLDCSSGLVLVTGPTGSGKTTTLYACLKHLQDGSTNIVTVEDPVEYRLPGLNQIQVNELIGVTFPSALRSVLRQDPDIILIGEIRDQETAKIAIQAAQTGHLVLATLHTSDAPGAISRLLDLGVDPLSLSEVLKGVLAQRLIRKNCSECTTVIGGNKQELYRADPILNGWAIPFDGLQEGAGCSACHHTGYHGRVGIYSYLQFTPGLSRLLLEEATLDELRSCAVRNGFACLAHAAFRMLQLGSTTVSEVRTFFQGAERTSPTSTQVRSVTENRSKVRGIQENLPPLHVLLIDENNTRRERLKSSLEHQALIVKEIENVPTSFVTFDDIEVVICTGALLLSPSSGQFVREGSGRHVPILALATRDLGTGDVGALRQGGFCVVPTSTSAAALARLARSEWQKSE